MIGPDDIDALAVARRILANPKTYRLSVFEEQAMAGCLVALDAQIEVLEVGPVRASLAAAIAAFIQAETVLVATCDTLRADPQTDTTNLPDQIEARKRAFNTLKTTFETEFPHV